MTADAKIMEALKNNYSIMAQPGKVNNFTEHVLERRCDPGSLQLHWEANGNFRQLLSTTMKSRKNFRTDKNYSLEVTTTMSIMTSLRGSVYLHTETAHTSQSSEKTTQDHHYNRLLQQEQARRQAGDTVTGRRYSDDQSLSPQQNSSAGSLQSTEIQYRCH